MDIHFVSSLTPEDELRAAEALCAAAGSLLDQFAIAYTIRIETTDGCVVHRSAPGVMRVHTDVATT
jgi:hypothetical protein